MKQHIETLVDSFVDYKGDTHYFVIAAISSEFPINTRQLNPSEFNYNDKVIHEVNTYVYNFGIYDTLCIVNKKVCIGIAICNPEDKFNVEIGKKKAIARAQTSKPALLATNKGYINKYVVQGLLQQEAKYIKNNPHLYIKGYADMEKAYLKNIQMQKFSEELSESERLVINQLKENPDFIKEAMDYLAYEQNRQNN